MALAYELDRLRTCSFVAGQELTVINGAAGAVVKCPPPGGLVRETGIARASVPGRPTLRATVVAAVTASDSGHEKSSIVSTD